MCCLFFFEISSLVYFWFWYFIFYQEKEKKEKNKSKTNAKKTFFVYFFSLSLSFLTFIYLSCWLRKYATGGLRPLIRSLLICSLVYKTSFWQPISYLFVFVGTPIKQNCWPCFLFYFIFFRNWTRSCQWNKKWRRVQQNMRWVAGNIQILET